MAKANRTSMGIAILLLATSGLALPMNAFGGSAGPVLLGPAPFGRLTGFPTTAELFVSVAASDGRIFGVFVPASDAGVPTALGIAAEDFQVLMAENMPMQSPPSQSGPGVMVVDTSLLGAVAIHGGEEVAVAVGASSNVPGPQQIQASRPLSGFPWIGQPGQLGMMRVAFGTMEAPLAALSYSATNGLTSAVPRLWSDFLQRRSKFEIYVEILELMKRGPMTPFEVAFYARLNHKRTKEYAEFLARSGFLQAVTEDGRSMYVLTRDGVGFLERVRTLFGGTRLIEIASYGYQRDF